MALSNHMVARDPMNPGPNNQIALIEKFIQQEGGEEDELMEGEDEDALRMGSQAQQEELGFGGDDGQQEGEDYQDQPSEFESQPYADGSEVA